MYTLIGSPTTRAARVLVCLEELGLDYHLDPVKPGSPEALKINPSGKVPALLVNDDIIFDSTAICVYLADKHGSMSFPCGTIERAHMDSWLQFILDEIDAPLWVWWKHSFILPKDKRIEAIKPTCRAEFERAMVTMEQRLGDNQFLMGDSFTVPDLIMAHCIDWATLGCRIPTPQGNLKAYFKRIRSRPAYKKVIRMIIEAKKQAKAASS